MARITLRDAIYSPFEPVLSGKDIPQSASEIGAVLQKHVAMIGQGRAYSYCDAGHHYLCSTMMDSVFSAGAIDPNLMGSAHPVAQSFTHAYECACWGYCLRYHFEHKREQRFLAISIIDVNSLEMKYWLESDHWGKSGFGITTLFFEISEDGDERELLHTGMAAGGNNMISFASVAKQVVKDFRAQTLSLPFFPASMSIPVRNSLKNVGLLTERHDAYGHAFGSDPWISFIKDHAQNDLSDRQIVFGSLALRGYYCFADVQIAPDVHTSHF